MIGGLCKSNGLEPMENDVVCIIAVFCASAAASPEGSKYAAHGIVTETTAAVASPIEAVNRKKYTTSPKRPDSHGTHSNRIASAETKTIGGGARRRYCFTNVHGSSGASPRTTTMAIDTSMKPPKNVARKRALPRNLPAMYSPLRSGVTAMIAPTRDWASRRTAFETT